MNTKQFLALEKRLLPSFPGFVINGTLMLMQPLGDVLRAFHFEPSSFSKEEFYVNVFFLPLYVPATHLHFTFGHRVGSSKRWRSDQPGLESALTSGMLKGVPFLMNLRTKEDVANALEQFTVPSESKYVNPHCYEAFAYALLRAGNATGAVRVIKTLLEQVNETVAWENEIASRARFLRETLLKGLEDAQQQLTVWRTATIRNLGLETFNSLAD